MNYNWSNKERTILDQALVDIQSRLKVLEERRPVNLKDIEKDIVKLNKLISSLKSDYLGNNQKVWQKLIKLGENQARGSWLTRLFKR